MEGREKRAVLFKKDRPFIRPIQIFDKDKYHKDIGILWVAYQKKPFQWLKPNLNQEQFGRKIEDVSKNEELLVAEDHNKNFKVPGMVGLFSVTSDGWKYEPHVQFMPWASKKNILRATVSFLQYIRYSKKVGVCVVHSIEESLPLFDKCCEYGVLHKVGKIVNGDPRGDEWIYSVRGKKCQAS